jgi:hypothetical protein
MATPQNGDPLRIIGAISKFAGTLVGTAAIAGKQILGSAKPPSEGLSGKPKPGEKTSQARSQRKKKAVRKTKKKKAVKRKGTGFSGKSGASKKKPAQSPAKKKKGATPRKKTTRRKTKKTAKSEVSSHSQDGLTSETDAGTNAPIEKQKPQVQRPIAKAETADKKLSSVNGSPEEGIGKKDTKEIQKSRIPIIEYNDKANKAVVPATSVL